MAEHAKHHDYHLVNPSPWPAVGATGAFLTAVGLIIWMRSMGGGAGLFGLTGPSMFFVGVLINSTGLAWLGVILFGGTVVFALITLPVELNASARAMAMLRDNGLVASDQDEKGASSVLNAAALTYVAALAQTLMTLLYYVSILSGGSRRR